MTIPKSQNENKKALIVGCGFVGSRLREVLLQNDWFVIAFVGADLNQHPNLK